MGTPVVDNPIGAECWNWYPPADTPEFIYCFFYDVIKGWKVGAVEPPNLHVFKMSQVDGQPCHWKHENITFGWKTWFGLDATECWLNLQDTTPQSNYYFHHTKAVSPPAEYELFTNFYQAPQNNWGYAGFGMILWFAGVSALIISFGFDHVDDLKLEIFPVDADSFVIKLCSLTLHTNVQFKISR